MNKEMFLRRLEQLLAPLAPEERRDALEYYREYLEEAGEENEAAALAELGDVEQLAKQLCADGTFEKRAPMYQPVRYPNAAGTQYDAPQYDRPVRQSGMPTGLKVLLWVLALLTSPVWLSLLLAAVLTVVSLVIALVVTMAAFVFAGVVLIPCAVGVLGAAGASGVLALGVGVAMLGVGMLLLALTVLAVRGVIALMRLCFGKRNRNAERGADV